MKDQPLRTSVVGSYPFPAWLEAAAGHLEDFGENDIAEMQDDAATVAIEDQMRAGLDVITDGEQARFDFNLSFYGYLSGIALEAESPRKWGPPAHDQRGKHEVTGELSAPRGLGTLEEFERLRRMAPPGQALKVSVPGPFTMSGRLLSNELYPDRYALTEALLPLIRQELADLVAAGCEEICVDEPSMSCYAYKADPDVFVDIFNRTVEPAVGKTRICSHLCFGNYKARGVGKRTPRAMFPAFLDMHVDEMHIETCTTNFVFLDLIEAISKKMDAAVGIIDVKSYYIETPEYVAAIIKRCLEYAPAD
ncbi:MAG: methionine synthase, partial [Roseibacillus sp.]